MVRTQNWQQKWFGKAKNSFAIAISLMLTGSCAHASRLIEEVTKILEKGIPIFIVWVDDTCHSCTRGNFSGNTVGQTDPAGFIKLKLAKKSFLRADREEVQARARESTRQGGGVPVNKNVSVCCRFSVFFDHEPAFHKVF